MIPTLPVLEEDEEALLNERTERRKAYGGDDTHLHSLVMEELAHVRALLRLAFNKIPFNRENGALLEQSRQYIDAQSEVGS